MPIKSTFEKLISNLFDRVRRKDVDVFSEIVSDLSRTKYYKYEKGYDFEKLIKEELTYTHNVNSSISTDDALKKFPMALVDLYSNNVKMSKSKQYVNSRQYKITIPKKHRRIKLSTTLVISEYKNNSKYLIGIVNSFPLPHKNYLFIQEKGTNNIGRVLISLIGSKKISRGGCGTYIELTSLTKKIYDSLLKNV